MFTAKRKAKEGLTKLLNRAFSDEELTDGDKAELIQSLEDALLYAQRRARASAIIAEAVAQLDTTVDLGLPNLPPLDLSNDIEAIRKLTQNQADSIENLGKIISAAAPIIVTALFAA